MTDSRNNDAYIALAGFTLAHAAWIVSEIEEGAVMGGAGSAVGEALQTAGVLKPLLSLGLRDEFIPHGDPARLLALQGLDAAGIEGSIRARFAELIDKPAPLKIVG